MGGVSSRDRGFGDERGSVLIAGLLIVFAITLLALGLLQGGVVESRQVSRSEGDVQAFYAAESGLNRAALDVQYDSIGCLAFGIKTAQITCLDATNWGPLNADNTTPSPLPGYSTQSFGSNAAYVVEGVNSADPTEFWLVATACAPGPAADPCPSSAKAAAKVRALIKRTLTSTTTTTTTTHPAFTWGAFGGQSLKFTGNYHTPPGLTADSYNSRACTPVPCAYGGTNAQLTTGQFGSNGSIDWGTSGGHDQVIVYGNTIGTTDVASDPSDLSLNGANVTVHGNLQSGGSIVANGVTNPTSSSEVVGGTITPNKASTQVQLTALNNCGSQYTGGSPTPYSNLTGNVTQYPLNADKTCNWSGTPISATWTYGGTTGSGTAGMTGSKAGQFVAGGGACVAFAPGNYCLSDVTFSGGTTIEITGYTTMVVDGQFTLSGGGFANITQDPQNMQLISTYGNAGAAGTNAVNDPSETKTGVSLTGGSDAYMTIYAPTTDVVVSGGGQLFGAVLSGRNVSFTGGSALHYDTFLGSGNANLVDVITTTTETTTTVVPGPTLWSLLSWEKLACKPSGSSWSCQ